LYKNCDIHFLSGKYLLLQLISKDIYSLVLLFVQGRTQGGGLGLKPTLDPDILQKLHYLRKGD